MVDRDAGDDGGDAAIARLPFDPDVVYEGERTACRFSVECRGDNQICVDDQCERHERFGPGDLEHSEWRRMSSEEIARSQLGGNGYSWRQMRVEDTQATDYLDKMGMMSWMFPGPDGPQLIFQTWHNERCKIATYGRSYEVTSIDFLTCFTAAVADDRTLAVGGVDTRDGQNTIALFRDGVQVWRVTVPQAVHERLALASNWGEHAEAGVPIGLYFLDGALYASVMRGTNLPENWSRAYPTNTHSDPSSQGLAFLRVSLADGSMEVLPVGGRDVHEGTTGWLAEESGNLIAFVSRRTGTDFPQHAYERLRIPGGERDSIIPEYAFDGKYFQPSHDRWILIADWSPICEATVVGVRESPVVVPVYRYVELCHTPEYSPEIYAMRGPRRAGHYVEFPHTPYPATVTYTGHPQFPIAHTAGQTDDVSNAMGPSVFLYDENGVETETPPHPPISVAGENGSASFSRFGKTLETPFWDAGEVWEPLGWIEWSLTRSGAGGGGL